MPDLVVDASVAAKWFVLEAMSDRALALLDPKLRLFAPDLLRLEVVATLSRRVREGVLTETQARTDASELPRFFASFAVSADLLMPAFDLPLEIGHPVFDCIYLALTRRTNALVITADAKFLTKLAGTPYAPMLIPLADWKP